MSCALPYSDLFPCRSRWSISPSDARSFLRLSFSCNWTFLETHAQRRFAPFFVFFRLIRTLFISGFAAPVSSSFEKRWLTDRLVCALRIRCEPTLLAPPFRWSSSFPTFFYLFPCSVSAFRGRAAEVDAFLPSLKLIVFWLSRCRFFFAMARSLADLGYRVERHCRPPPAFAPLRVVQASRLAFLPCQCD